MMKKLILLTLIFSSLLATSSVSAQSRHTVVINEISWMGTTSSSSDEWIELKNITGDTIDLSGWTLIATDGTPTIELEGVIPSQGYYLLERTDDDTTPLLADKVYTGALANGGEILTLFNSSNEIVDVVGNANSTTWFAGNNTTKSTMERISPIVDGAQSSAWIDSAVSDGTAQNSISDSDNDTYGYSPNLDWPDEDCNDSTSAVYPSAPEMLDTFDNDCDIEIDEGFNLGTLQYETFFNGVEVLTALSPSDEVSEIEQAILDVINNAQSSLDIAVYDFTRESIKTALINAHNRGVTIRVVTNYGYNSCNLRLKESVFSQTTCEVMTDLIMEGIEVHPSDYVSYLQHNKFIVADNSTILTGSSNWTNTGLTYNLNNAIVLYSDHIAKAYSIEFEEMWLGEFATSKEDDTPHAFQFEQGLVEVYFSPSDNVENRTISLFEDAEDSIAFGIFFWTSDVLGQTVLDKFVDGVNVYGVWDALGSRNQYSEDDILCDAGVPIKIELGGGKMHHKVAIIDANTDNPKLLTGSYNWSAAGTGSNDENSLIFTGFNDLVQVYSQQIDDVYNALPAQTICDESISPEGGIPACSDRKDNDFDGLVDASDPDCRESTILACTDGSDNDGDGYEDDEDSDCFLAFNSTNNPLQIKMVSNKTSNQQPLAKVSAWATVLVTATIKKATSLFEK